MHVNFINKKQFQMLIIMFDLLRFSPNNLREITVEINCSLLNILERFLESYSYY